MYVPYVTIYTDLQIHTTIPVEEEGPSANQLNPSQAWSMEKWSSKVNNYLLVTFLNNIFAYAEQYNYSGISMFTVIKTAIST